MALVSNGTRVSRGRPALLVLLGLLSILAVPEDHAVGQSNLVAAWALSEGTGSTAADESGNGNTATLNGAAWTASGRFDAAVTFDGVDDRLDVADASSLDLSNAMTAEAWVYADASSQARTLVAKEESGGIVYGLFLTSASKVELRVKAAGTMRTVTSVTSISSSTWTHVAGTYDGVHLRVWINGLEESSLAATGTIAASDQPLRIGGDTILNQPFSGRIDEIRLYSHALDATELVADMDLAVDDVTAPAVSTKSPGADATGVSVTANVTATFSESLASSTVTTSTFELRDPQNALVSATVSYSDATRTATLDPSADLAGSTTYTATLKGGGPTPRVTDLAGNGLAADYSWSFTTADTSAPTVTSVTPVSGTRNVPLTTTITAVFNEPLDAATVTTSTFELRDTRNALVMGTVAYDASTRTATFTPSAPLLPTRTYTATLIGGASGLEDIAGNALAANYVWSFITTVEPTRVAAGSSHSVAVDDAGQVWTWGNNTFGQRGTSLDPRLPAAVTGATMVTAVAAGANHTLALKSDGTVLAWGWNGQGQLGNGNQLSQSTPVTVSSLTGVVAVAAGNTHSVALKSDRTVWTWGSGAQIGDGANTLRLTPVQVTALSDVIAIAASNGHSLALKADGSVWGWGLNSAGQLGDGTSASPRLTPVQVSSLSGAVGIAAGFDHSLAIVGSDLSLRSWGANTAGQLGDGTATPRTTPGTVSSLTNVRHVSAAPNRSGAAMLDGTGRSWGAQATSAGGTSTTPVTLPGNPPAWQLSIGQNHAVAVSADGVVSAWAANTPSSGQVGDGTFVARPTAVQISEASYAWKVSTPNFNPRGSGTVTAVQNVSVTALTSGATVRYTTDGTDPTEASTAVPANNIVVVDQSLTLKARAWKTGQPASNIDATTYTLQVPAPTFSPPAGTYTAQQSVTLSCALAGTTIRYTLDGSDPTPASTAYATPIAVSATTTIKARAYRSGWTDSNVATGAYTLKAAPLSFSPDGGAYSGPTAVTISTATAAAAIRYTLDGSEPTTSSPLYEGPVSVAGTTTLRATAWNDGWSQSDTKIANYRISLGTAATPTFDPPAGTYSTPLVVRISSSTPGAVIRFTTDGSEPSARSPRYMWSQLAATTTTFKAKAFAGDFAASATATATYALDAAGAVATPSVQPAGGEYVTQQTVTVSVATAGATIRYTTNGADPTETDAAVASGGTVVVSSSLPLKVRAFMTGLAPSAIRRADYAITGAVAAGATSSYANKSDGSAWAWGSNSLGQLGDNSTQTRTTPVAVVGVSDVVAIAAGRHHALALKRNGTVYAWGHNATGQLGLGDTTARHTATQIAALADVVGIAAGDHHSVAVKADGSVWAWGANWNGQVGDGSPTHRNAPVQVTALSGVRQIAAGASFSIAVRDDGAGAGSAWAWGQNNRGQLGDGTTTDRSTPIRVGVLTDVASAGAGPETAYAITSDGRLWAWGRNHEGQVGDSTNYIDAAGAGRRSPVLLPDLGSAGDGISGGGGFTATRMRDGAAWAWGRNTSSELGDGTHASRNYPDRVPPIAAALRLATGEQHTLAAKADGTVWGWGSNSSGTLGNGSQQTSTAIVQVPGFTLADNAWLVGDPDADGLATWLELRSGSDPLADDTNADGVADGVSESLRLAAANPDFDGDGLSNPAEGSLGTDPFNADSDGDGVADRADAFPLDSSRSQPPSPVPGDTTPPVITLTYPSNAQPVPPPD